MTVETSPRPIVPQNTENLETLSVNSQPGIAPPIQLGTRLEPFVDTWLLENQENITHRLTPPVKEEIVLVAGAPWESDSSNYYVFVQDEEKVRLYYRGYHTLGYDDASPQQATCYAESVDGIHFTCPPLGLYEFAGSRQNNIIHEGVQSHNFAPFLDTNPAALPAERYKAVGGLSGCFHVFASPDGIHWHKWHDEPIIIPGKLDSLNVVFWDESLKLYRCYARYFDTTTGEAVRAIHSLMSLDLLYWSEAQPNRYGEIPLEHFYTNAVVPHPNAPHILLSFPMRFIESRRKIADHPEPGVSDAVFMSSRDGVNWERGNGGAWIRPGLDQRNWTERNNMTARGIVQTSPQEYSVYLSEHYHSSTNRLRRYSIRRDGFASLHARFTGGSCTTKPLTFTGEQLILNYSTSAAGSIRVEVQDENGIALPGYALADMEPLFGDELDAVIRWKQRADVSELRGRVVRFYFELREADFFSLQIVPAGEHR
jgi:hypothetical protein